MSHVHDAGPPAVPAPGVDPGPERLLPSRPQPVAPHNMRPNRHEAQQGRAACGDSLLCASFGCWWWLMVGDSWRQKLGIWQTLAIIIY